MAGGRGSDTYFVQSVHDQVIEGNVPGIDTVKSFVSFSLAGQRAENLALLKFTNINATGNSLANVITGNDGANILKGGAGNDNLAGADSDDVLVGGAGKDTLVGGPGHDKFDFNKPGDSVTGVNRDVINNFHQNEKDKIDLATIDANTTTSGNQVFQFIGGQAFHGVAGELRYAGGIVSGDVDGNGIADFEIKVVGIAGAAYAHDFVL